MNTAVKVFLSMSLSGGLLILGLLAGRRFLWRKVSRQWRYYIWLPALLRLLLPFGPETTLIGTLWQAAENASAQTAPVVQSAPDRVNLPVAGTITTEGLLKDSETAEEPIMPAQTAPGPVEWICAVWFVVFLLMLTRKITAYQSFLRYMRAGAVPVSDTRMLDRLAEIEEKIGVKKPVELFVNPMAASPMLIGFFRPCIILPSAAVSGEAFSYIALHELTHYKRLDIVYKWLVQVTVCLHWFNPLVYRMSREIERECEFSCDEAVLSRMGWQHASAYGKTLLDAMAAAGAYREPLGGVSLSENKQLLKERLAAMMDLGKGSKAVWFLMGALTAGILVSAVFLGVYPAAGSGAESGPQVPALSKTGSNPASVDGTGIKYAASDENILQQVQEAYDAGSLPLFQIAYSKLNPSEQSTWMQKTYTDENIAFFSICMNQRKDADDPQARDFLKGLAERIYENDEISFFSIVAEQMSDEEKETWLNQAMEDEKNNFQSALLDQLLRGDEKSALQEQWNAALRRDYEKVGVTSDGRNYYYNGELVNVLLDMQTDKKNYKIDKYVLNANPEGTINIMIGRRENGEIKTVEIMTPEEAEGILNAHTDKSVKLMDEMEEKEWVEKQAEEYRAAGVTIEGKDYYYQGQLVHTFLDIRANKSFYTLNTNPKGTIDIRIVRDENNAIQEVVPMTEEEATALLEES